MIDQTKISGHVWGVGRLVWGAGVGVCARTRVCEYVWDGFSEFLPENRVPTSADFNMYPIRILLLNSHILHYKHYTLNYVPTLF